MELDPRQVIAILQGQDIVQLPRTSVIRRRMAWKLTVNNSCHSRSLPLPGVAGNMHILDSYSCLCYHFTPEIMNGTLTTPLSWAQVCAMPWLKDLPCKVELNRFGKILMSPAANWHGRLQHSLGKQLDHYLPGGVVIVECAIDTSDGVRVADVAWISRPRWLPHRKSLSLPLAPEICVEILSPSNTHEEMLGKMQLYFAAGAAEVWLCNDEGGIEFFIKEQTEPVITSILCPCFPCRVETD